MVSSRESSAASTWPPSVWATSCPRSPLHERGGRASWVSTWNFAPALGPHEWSVLASISKWKADIFYKLAQLTQHVSGLSGVESGAGASSAGICTDGLSADGLQQYLEAQMREIGESLLQPLSLQCERWLQSTVSLSLRGLHQLASVPSELSAELLVQARALLALAYQDLGALYARTGRYTKAMTHAKQGIELFAATRDKVHALTLQLWLSRLQLRMAMPHAADVADGIHLENVALLRSLPAMNAGQEHACTQVVTTLRRALQGFEEQEDAEREVKSEAQTLLGCVLLRQGLARTRRLAPPFCAVCRLCEEEGALPCALELLQVSELPGIECAQEALDLLHQAAACFKDAGDVQLNGMSHACLAALYFCGRQDARVHRLALTHCGHASRCLARDAPTSLVARDRSSSGAEEDGSREVDAEKRGESVDDPEHRGAARQVSARSSLEDEPALRLAVQIAVQLLEAKALCRRHAAKGQTSRATEARAGLLLCDVSLGCLRGDADERKEAPRAEADGAAEAVQLRTLLSDEQRSPLMSYVKQELGAILLRLLKGADHREEGVQNLKDLYCSLLTAWHAEAGHGAAAPLTALRAHLANIAS
eukprot:TRINITY_DN10914_c0_g3_i1.p1 TRINITY_DN10914_c0_g3~~TRINITY_DN10914_c0_g3_i1.p1  ORF type:complete len:596 (-),score=102.51 TRINITY_DN10914_c0_g3_i1:191-1978(-)